VAQPNDGHRLLLIEEESGSLVAIAAHERGYLLESAGEPVAGTHLRLLVIVDHLRGTTMPDGRSVFRSVLGLVLADIEAQGRQPWIEMIVEADNAKMLSMCRSLDGHVERPLLSGDSAFLLCI